MAFSAAAVNDLFAAVVSHAQTLGVFDRVNQHEPKSAPGAGLSCSFWLESVKPEGRASGVNITSGVITISARVYQSFLSKPEDGIDPNVLSAVSALLNAYSGDFTLGDTVMAVDLLGMYGTSLSAQAGYLEQDGKMFRVMECTVPIIVDDIWGQAS